MNSFGESVFSKKTIYYNKKGGHAFCRMFVSIYWWFVSHFKPTRLLTSGSSLKVGPVGGAVVTTFLYKKSYFGTKKMH